VRCLVLSTFALETTGLSGNISCIPKITQAGKLVNVLSIGICSGINECSGIRGAACFLIVVATTKAV